MHIYHYDRLPENGPVYDGIDIDIEMDNVNENDLDLTPAWRRMASRISVQVAITVTSIGTFLRTFYGPVVLTSVSVVVQGATIVYLILKVDGVTLYCTSAPIAIFYKSLCSSVITQMLCAVLLPPIVAIRDHISPPSAEQVEGRYQALAIASLTPWIAALAAAFCLLPLVELCSRRNSST